MLKCFVLTFLVVIFGREASAAAASCPGTTPEIEACFKSKLDSVEAELRQYSDAAAKLIDERHDPDETLAAFRKGEVAWAAYRDAECDAVYDKWSNGTIRGIMGLTCARLITEARTHEVWLNWLTYMDSTPPVLPEPVVEADR